MELTKTYDPSRFEPDIYMMWEKAEAFLPSGQGEPYAIIMPPPNANGNWACLNSGFAGYFGAILPYERS